MTANTQVRQPQMGLTFQDVWAAMMETREQMKETDRLIKETDRIIKENAAQQKETDKKFQKTEQLVKELSKNIGGVNNSLGDMAEGLMASDLYETFAALGLDFDNSIPNYRVKEKKTKRKLAEVDMLLVNGTIAMAVEVKAAMTIGDVSKHENRMWILRREPNSLFANRTLYGAMAGVKMSEKTRQYARGKGFFVIELTGNTIKIDMPEGFKPKTW
jgi:hypothetical protein